MYLSRRDFLKLAAISGAAAPLMLSGLSGCGRSRHAKTLAQKVIVIGFDGLEPTLVEKWAEKGLLPNVAKMMRAGGYTRLATTNPPESPVAWSSFATGTNPGKTGIFDFLRRDPETYYPFIAAARAKRPKFLWGLIPTSRRAPCR